MTEPPAITYVAARWGQPTETFVRREAAAVAALGVEVRARSIGRPVRGEATIDVDHLTPAKVLWGALRSAVAHPLRTVVVLATVVRRSAPRNLVTQLSATGVGLAWASTFADRRSHLHVHFGWVAATAAWACTRITDQPFSVVLHAFELHVERYQDAFAPIPLRAASTTFAISAFDAELASARWDLPVEVLHMGVTDEWLEDRRPERPCPVRWWRWAPCCRPRATRCSSVPWPPPPSPGT